MWLYPVPIGIGPGRGGGACNRELPRILLLGTPVNKLLRGSSAHRRRAGDEQPLCLHSNGARFTKGCFVHCFLSNVAVGVLKFELPLRWSCYLLSD
jgi:hypothetical protein